MLFILTEQNFNSFPCVFHVLVMPKFGVVGDAVACKFRHANSKLKRFKQLLSHVFHSCVKRADGKSPGMSRKCIFLITPCLMKLSTSQHGLWKLPHCDSAFNTHSRGRLPGAVLITVAAYEAQQEISDTLLLTSMLPGGKFLYTRFSGH